MMLPGAMNTDALLAWVHTALIPTLTPGDIVIWGNLWVHKDPAVAAAMTAAGARLKFLPLYSPRRSSIRSRRPGAR